jgi:hypothetical protein
VAAFSAAVAVVVTTSLVLLRRLRLARLAPFLLGLAVLSCAQVVGAVELLSLAHAISGAALLALHAAVLGALLACGLRPAPLDLRARARLVWRILADAPWAVRLLATTTGATALVLLFLVLYVPPNNYDSLQYHLTRAITYLRHGSLDAYATPDLRETIFPANSEILILWPIAFWAQERTAGLVQWLAWLGSGVALLGIGRRLGFRVAPALTAALAFLSFPAVLLQASTTQNDLLTTFFVLCAFAFVAEVAAEGRSALLLAATALGLAVGTKSTAALAVPGLALWAVLCLREGSRGGRGLGRRMASFAAAGALGIGLFGAYFYLQNLRRYGHPSGPPAFRDLVMLDRHDPGVLWSNLGRLSLRLVELEGPLTPEAGGKRLFHVHNRVAEQVFRRLRVRKVVRGADFNHPLASWRDTDSMLSEDITGFGPVFTLVGLPALVFASWRRRGVLVLAVTVVSYVGLVAATLRWQAWHSRILITAVGVAAPALAAVLGRGGWLQAPGRWLVVLASVSCQWACGLFNVRKPILGPSSVLGRERTAVLELGAPLRTALVALDAVEPPIRRLALVISGPGDFRSPFFGERFERDVESLRLDPAHAFDAARLSDFDAVAVLGPEQTFFLEHRPPDSPASSWGVVSTDPLVRFLRAEGQAWHALLDTPGLGSLFVRKDRALRPQAILPDFVDITGELGGSWVGPVSRAVVRVDPERPRLAIAGETVDFGVTQRMTFVRADGSVAKEVALPRSGRFTVHVPMPRVASKRPLLYVPLELRCGPTFNPKRLGLSEDARDLTLRILEWRLVPAPVDADGAESGAP